MKKILLIIFISVLGFSFRTEASEEEKYQIMGTPYYFDTTEKEELGPDVEFKEINGVFFIEDRLALRTGDILGAEKGQYIELILEDGTVIKAVCCGIDSENNKAITGILSSSEKGTITLSEIESDWNTGIKEIVMIPINLGDDISIGEEIASYAQLFIGNPYEWGGESLTDGADCSGFTKSIYSNFGISLPHNASSQSLCGNEVSVTEILPGDLIFYSGEEGIDHVAIYIGDGQIVHASNSKPYPDGGIKISKYDYREITCIRRVR